MNVSFKITAVQHLNYWERLDKLKFFLQRRGEPYIIIYMVINTAYGAKY